MNVMKDVDLRESKFFVIFSLYLVYMYIVTVYVETAIPKPRRYSQQEVDDAWKKMIKRENFLVRWGNQTGCWPNNFIPFYIRRGFTIDQIQHMYNHMIQIQNKTCIRWVEDTKLESAKKTVEFVPQPDDPVKCETQEIPSFRWPKSSPAGIAVKLMFGEDCFPKQLVIREMLHALGILHEHQRIDRDCYVTVDPGKLYDRQYKIIYDDLAFERWPYDKRSIVHFNRDSFVKDKDESFWDFAWEKRLGDSYGFFGRSYGQLTALDIQKLNYRFCGGPDYCDIHPIRCDEIEEQEKNIGCKQLYEDIVKGIVTPTDKRNG